MESPKSLTPTGGKGLTGPGENPERPIPKHGKGTDDPKHRDMTDMSMGKKQPAQIKKQLTNGYRQMSVTIGKNK